MACGIHCVQQQLGPAVKLTEGEEFMATKKKGGKKAAKKEAKSK